jgi:transposase
MGGETPEDPVIFLKPNTAIIGPNIPIQLPANASPVHHEGELAAVIGRPCKDVPAAKAADVIGLYLNPPQNALVLSVDEKPSIQALERARGYVQTSSGKIVQGMKSTYKRHGTINLFAALEVATGIIRGKTTPTKKRADFQAFMEEVIAGQPAERQIHVILDNLSTHKRNDEWLAAHPNVTFHFTPTSASWLNQVEIWFGIFQRKALRNASFASIDQLVGAIRDFTAAYNENAAPFVWRKREVKGSQLRNTIVNLRN